MNESWTVDGPRVITVGEPEDAVRELRIRLVAGRVDVVAREEANGTATVEVSSVRGRPLEVRRFNGALEVGYPYLRWDSFIGRFRGAAAGGDTAEVSLAVPQDVAVSLGTISAEGVLSGTRGRAEVRTVSGVLVLNKIRGAVTARTVSGGIDVRDQEGPLHSQSVSGPLTVHGGSVSRLHVKTVSGEIGLDLRTPPSVVDVASVSGDVTVRVPHGTGYAVTARSISGRVVAGDRDLASSLRQRGGGYLSDGDGALRLVVRTVSGDVTLVRADPA